MDMKHPWDGRDLTNATPKSIDLIVLDHKKIGDHNCKKQSCIDSVSGSNCLNTDIIQKKKHKKVTVKVPVVLAEPQIEINLESIVKLPEPAIEIKRIRKNVELTQCKIVPSFYRDKKPVFKIFLAGFVRKNIEYATADFGNQQKINGNIRHTTVKVPFSCITEIQLEKGVSPSLQFQDPNPIAELEFLDPCNKLSRDQREFGNINAEFLNEHPFCELVKTSVIELDIILDERPYKKGGHTDKIFRTFKEKMVVLITLKVLQNQQVSISKEKNKDKKKKEKKKHKKEKENHKQKDKYRDTDRKKDKDNHKDNHKDKDKDHHKDMDKDIHKDKDKFQVSTIIDQSIN